MRDHSQERPEPETETAEPGTGLVAHRLAWERDPPAWLVTTDLEPIPEAELF